MIAQKTKRTRPPVPARPKSRPAAQPGRYVLRLYVAGATLRSREAVLRVRQLCAAEPDLHCDLRVIDIFQQPRLARLHQIVATPTLVISFPRPLRRFIGNLMLTPEHVFHLVDLPLRP